ncbi:MAG: hypothetical protein AAFN77_02905 [Planctomycetota bacterium]
MNNTLLPCSVNVSLLWLLVTIICVSQGCRHEKEVSQKEKLTLETTLKPNRIEKSEQVGGTDTESAARNFDMDAAGTVLAMPEFLSHLVKLNETEKFDEMMIFLNGIDPDEAIGNQEDPMFLAFAEDDLIFPGVSFPMSDQVRHRRHYVLFPIRTSPIEYMEYYLSAVAFALRYNARVVELQIAKGRLAPFGIPADDVRGYLNFDEKLWNSLEPEVRIQFCNLVNFIRREENSVQSKR